MTAISTDHMTLGEALQRLTPAQRPPGDLASVDNQPSAEWDLNTNFESASRLARDGWREKAEELERVMLQIRNLTPEGFSFSHDVSGESVDVGAFLAGEPECMIAVQPPAVRNVSLLVNVSARSSADARLLLNRGIAVASLVYSLQAQAYGVSLRIAEWVQPRNGGEGYHETLIEINQPGEYIDPARLAFWLGHPAVLRRCIFRFNEQQSQALRDQYGFHPYGGYGTPTDPPQGHTGLHGAIVIPFPDTDELNNYRTPREALGRIAELVSQQGLAVNGLPSP